MEIKYVSSSLRLFSRNISPLSFHFHHLEAKYLKATHKEQNQKMEGVWVYHSPWRERDAC